jgi:hypothetical protein
MALWPARRAGPAYMMPAERGPGRGEARSARACQCPSTDEIFLEGIHGVA